MINLAEILKKIGIFNTKIPGMNNKFYITYLKSKYTYKYLKILNMFFKKTFYIKSSIGRLLIERITKIIYLIFL